MATKPKVTRGSPDPDIRMISGKGFEPLNVKKIKKSIVFNKYSDYQIIEGQALNGILLENVFMKSPTMTLIKSTRQRSILPRHDPQGIILDVVPRFRKKCSNCKEEFQRQVEECEYCKEAGELDKSELISPNIKQKPKLRDMLKHPNNDDTLYDVLASNLSHDTYVDEWIVSIEYNYESSGQGLANVARRSTAKALYVENPAYIYAVEDIKGSLQGRTWHCPFHATDPTGTMTVRMFTEPQWEKAGGYCPENHAMFFAKSPNIRVPLEKTAWIQKIDGRVRAAFAKEEIVFGSTTKLLPYKRAFPRAGAMYKSITIIDSMRDLNWEIYSQGHVTSLLVFQNLTQTELNTLEKESEQALRLQTQYDPISGETKSSKRGYIHWIAGDALEVSRVPLMEQFNTMQTLEFYEFHWNELLTTYGMFPLLTRERVKGDQNKMELVMEQPAIEADQGSIVDKWNNFIIPAFGISDWVVQFRNIRQRDKLKEAQTLDFIGRAAANLTNAGIVIKVFDDGTVSVSGDNTEAVEIAKKLKNKQVETMGQPPQGFGGKPVSDKNKRGQGQRMEVESERTGGDAKRKESPAQEER